MASPRYTIKPLHNVVRQNVRVTEWRVIDSKTNTTAKGTKGYQGVGGYATRNEAQAVCDDLNRKARG